jgi:mono/diheme cytochrome c family protein
MNICPVVVIKRLMNIRIFLYIAIISGASMGCLERTDPYFQRGKELYATYCVACHGINGGGVLYRKSALDHDVFVTGDHKEVISVILYGREGVGVMPGWGVKLTDQEIAAVTTYIRQAWSNRADPVTPAMVKEIRSTGN